MKVKVYQATLIIEGKEKLLTRSIARQFPVCPACARDVPAGMAKEPFCKVRGEVLGHVATWLYLVEDEEGGLAWEYPMIYSKEYADTVREAGRNVDDPRQVQTVIL